MLKQYFEKSKVLEALDRAMDKDVTWSMSPSDIINQMLEYVEKVPTVEVDLEGLIEEALDLNNRRHLIWAIGCDYDGCNTVESLKGLIDELVSYTQLPKEEIHDITSVYGTWVHQDNGKWKCSCCGKETDLPNYDKAIYCFNCRAKMLEKNKTITKGNIGNR